MRIDEMHRQYYSFFTKIWDNPKPLGKLFRTTRRGYIYDTGTNKLLGCDELVFELLQNFFILDTESAMQTFLKKHGDDEFIHAAESIKDSIESENILKFKRAKSFYLTGEKCGVDEMIQAYQELLVLETTTRCNMRCGYCIYQSNYKGNRNHGTRDMSREVAERAINHLREHSYKQDRVAISYYGGEPALCWDLIEWCVEYAKKMFKDKQVDFSVTTNGTLITPEIARFLHNNNFLTLLSTDGTESVHNSFRKYRNGKGSYKDSMRGLRYLIDAYGDSTEKRLKLSMVYTPPFSSDRLDEIAGLWAENEWLPEKMGLNIVYPTPGTVPYKFSTVAKHPENKSMMEWAFEKFRGKYNQKSQSNPLADYIAESAYTRFIQRPLYNVPNERINLNGCCVPGARRLFVTVDGSFHLCERIDSNTPPIGNVYAGVDIEAVKAKYIDRYMDLNFPECSNCWAARLCNACYKDTFK